MQPGQSVADDHLTFSQAVTQGRHQSVIGLGRLIIVVAPEAAFDLPDALNFSDRLGIGQGDQIVAAGHEFLNNELGAALQHLGGFPLQRLGKKHGGGQGKDDEGVHR